MVVRLSSTTQSTDYKTVGVNDICEIKRAHAYEENEKGKLSKTLIRKIFEIVNDSDNLNKVIPDLAYLAARNGGLSRDSELGSFITKVIDMISKGTPKNAVIDYLEGAVMATYIIETIEDEEENIDYRDLLNCGKRR